MKRPTLRYKAAPKAPPVPQQRPAAKAAQAHAGKPAPKPAQASRTAAPPAKPRPVFRRERKPQVRRFPKFALHKHPTSVSYGPDEWRMVLDALPLIQQWLREQAPGAAPQAGALDLQIAAIRVWESEELDHVVLNLRRDPAQLAFGLAKAGLIAERAAEVEAWLGKNAS